MADPPLGQREPASDARDAADPPGAPDAPTDGGTLFQTDHLQPELRGRAVRGGAITLVGQAVSVALRLLGLAALARLLVPEDFGLMYGVLAVTGFITMFREAGLSTATIQRDRITPAQISTLFWLNVALGAAVAAVIVAVGPVLAWLYGDPRAMWVAFALAGTALIGGFAVQHQALLRRQMRFGTTVGIDLGSAALGLAVAVVAAWYGAGVWALVMQQYGMIVARSALMLAAAGWMPGLPRRGTGVRPMVRFGAQLTGSSLLNYATRNGDHVLLATFIGAGPLGLYGNAYRLLMFPLQSLNFPLSGVAVPTLSRLQDQPDRFQRYYFQAIAVLVCVSMPIVGFAFAEAPRLVELVLGANWLPAADIFRVLAPAAFMATFNIATGWAYVALGRTGRQLQWNALSTVLTLSAFVVGLQWGAVGVAAALSIVQVAERGPALWYCYRGTFLRLRDIGATLARPATASIVAAAATMTLRHLYWEAYDWPVLVQLAAAGAVYLLTYLALWRVMPGGWRTLMSNIEAARALRKPRTNTQGHG